MGGEICPKMDFNLTTVRHGRVNQDHLHESAINKSSLQQKNALDRFANNVPDALLLLLVAFFQFQASFVKNVANHSLS